MVESILEKFKSLPVLIGTIVVALLIVGGTAWHFFGPQNGGAPVRPLTAEEQANKTWIEEKARETGGDFTKLGSDDQQRLRTLNGPRAPFEFMQVARSLGQKK
jgi:hypothetical protein